MSAQRLHHLDNLRVFCMMFGVLLQANRVGDFSIASHVSDISDYFRMAAFFTISGYFMQMVLMRDRAAPILKRRVVVLCVPLIFALLLINPLTNSIASQYVSGAVSLNPLEALQAAMREKSLLPTPDGVLLHLWFLIVLIGFVALSPLFAKGLSGLAKLKHARPDRLLITLAISIALYSVLARGAEEVISRVLQSDLTLFRAFLRYLPYFLLGMAACVSTVIWDTLHRISVPVLAVGALMVAGGYMLPALSDGAIGTLYAAAARAVLTTGMVALMLALFQRFANFGTPLTLLASQGVYTAYLLQILLVWVAGAGAISIGLEGTALYLTTVIVTLFAGHLIWYYLVRPVPIFSLLLSGKWQVPHRALS